MLQGARYAAPQSTQQYRHTRPVGLRAVAKAAETSVDDIAVDLIVNDTNTPEWVKKWIVADVLPAVAAAVESLRVAAADMERRNTRPAEPVGPVKVMVLKGRNTANKFPEKVENSQRLMSE